MDRASERENEKGGEYESEQEAFEEASANNLFGQLMACTLRFISFQKTSTWPDPFLPLLRLLQLAC